MNDQLIIRDDSALQVQFTEAALALKEEALASAALIGKVTSAKEQVAAVEAQKKLRQLCKVTEDARYEIKKPILEYGRRVDNTAAKFVKDLNDEETRISKLISSFQTAERERVLAAERLRQKKEREIAEAAAKAEAEAQSQAEAERAKLEAERRKAEQTAKAAKNAEDRAKAETEQARIAAAMKLAEEQAQAERERIVEAQAKAVASLPVAEAARVDGQRVTTDWNIMVTDIWLLARAHSNCVKITPLISEIKSLLNAGIKVAGVNAVKETKASVRTSATPLAIEV